MAQANSSGTLLGFGAALLIVFVLLSYISGSSLHWVLAIPIGIILIWVAAALNRR